MLSEAAANIVENLACRIAQRQGGKIAPNHLMPYLPMSLELIKSCLDTMVDGTSVVAAEQDNIIEYEFASYRDAAGQSEILKVDSCVSCNTDITGVDKDVLCPTCAQTLRNELNLLAEKMGWPAQAVYEHEILYLAAGHQGPVHAEDLAGHSRYTLRSMRRKLDKISLDNYLRQELDRQAGMMTYYFPEIIYSKELYRKNMIIIRTYPASVTEEVEMKITRILFTLGWMFLGLLALALLHVPFPLLILLFLVSAPVVALIIWRHKSRAEE